MPSPPRKRVPVRRADHPLQRRFGDDDGVSWLKLDRRHVAFPPGRSVRRRENHGVENGPRSFAREAAWLARREREDGKHADERDHGRAEAGRPMMRSGRTSRRRHLTPVLVLLDTDAPSGHTRSLGLIRSCDRAIRASAACGLVLGDGGPVALDHIGWCGRLHAEKARPCRSRNARKAIAERSNHTGETLG
jgi:hypothetical protein